MRYLIHQRAMGLVLSLLLAEWLEAAPPRVLDERLELQLVAEHPDIVTPIGLAFDGQGRLLVVECHTHFPPEGYSGPKTDRVRLVLDHDGDGTADEMKTFYEGTHATMSLRRGPDDWIYVATRMEVFRIRDTNDDDVADVREDLVRLETRGNYPHNGLCGLAFDADGQLYFGLGENLGEPYTVVGGNGRQLSGGGEGGNIYRCRADGSQLQQVATGFWNPFGICVDSVGRIFTVDNDPDASPPCRLLHVVPGGDYGYQFRYGRPGRHPLQAWNGELPGTLPMLAGTGEAPSAVLPYHGQLWVSSWGDYRIERFSLNARGASFISSSETVVQGDDNFRPVDFAVAPDGSLYFTDWVDQSYPVHGRGRIWRLAWKDKSNAPNLDWPPLNDTELRAAELRQSADFSALNAADVFEHQAAAYGLLSGDRLANCDWTAMQTAEQRLGVLAAARWQSLAGAPPRMDWIEKALGDTDPRVRLIALRWVADAKLKQFRPLVELQLQAAAITPRLFQATLATLEWLDTGRVSSLGENPSYEHYLVTVLRDAANPSELRLAALKLLDPNHRELGGLLESLLSSDEDLQREAVRTLVLQSDPARYARLADIADDERRPVQLRADAVAGLAERAAEYRPLLEKLANGSDAAGREATRLLGDRRMPDAERPATDDVDAWVTRISGGGDGDAEAGWRVFFGQQARCGACHRFEGRGSDVGPDLTLVGETLAIRRLVDSILNPQREIAPQFVPWNIETDDGRVLVGLALGPTSDGRSERFLASDGSTFDLHPDAIAARTASQTSIMPSGIEQSLSDQELRDLIAFLTSGARQPASAP